MLHLGPRAVLIVVLLMAPGFGSAAENPFRLPQTVIPEAYRLELTIVPDKPSFSGHAEIDVIITEPSDVIWLHGRDLDVSKVRIVFHGASKAIKARYEQVSPDGLARLTPARRLEPQRVTLMFDYEAAFGAGLNGLYKVRSAKTTMHFLNWKALPHARFSRVLTSRLLKRRSRSR